MKAFFLYGKEDMRPQEVALPPVEDYDLLIKILACGVCGSDMRMFFSGPSPRYALPIVLGHEFTGRVTQLGPKVRGYAVGDLVTVAPIIPCLRCNFCTHGQDNLCENGQVIGCNVQGAFAEFMHIPGPMVMAGGVVKLPPEADPRGAALTELVGCCLHGLHQVGVEPGDRVLIIGDGPIGLTFLQLARLMGAGYVATSGHRPARRQLARELGAHEALDGRAVDLKGRFSRSLDLVIVAAANIDVTAEALELVRPGGRLLLFSGYVYGTTMPLDVNAVHYRELHISGSIDCTINDFRRAAQLLPQLQMQRLISASFPLDRTVEAFRAGKDPDAVKVIVEP